MRWLICFIFGHQWCTLRVNHPKAAARAHLHSFAGCDADCLRCGEKWRDAG